jgi:hypothetical protein
MPPSTPTTTRTTPPVRPPGAVLRQHGADGHRRHRRSARTRRLLPRRRHGDARQHRQLDRTASRHRARNPHSSHRDGVRPARLHHHRRRANARAVGGQPARAPPEAGTAAPHRRRPHAKDPGGAIRSRRSGPSSFSEFATVLREISASCSAKNMAMKAAMNVTTSSPPATISRAPSSSQFLVSVQPVGQGDLRRP